eukprot:TRINITY_DN8724_c0_g1_i2.p1 TRINITY_DN8724_c0_g1~~TRINITY_DN8724_c0_g1_i2.p1  ORF type:complete len:459 (+),score=229.80 TRINITY_DN8724_c0_g1_i2:32-1378(+)
MPYKKGKRVKRRTHQVSLEEEKLNVEAPKSLVFCRGKVGNEVNTLMREWREVMQPFTASKLKIVKKNKVKDILELSKHFGCTTVHVFSCTPASTNFKILRSPQGPTLTFKVESFKLKHDIQQEQRRPHSITDSNSFAKPPLVVFNQFNNAEAHHQLMMTTIQGMFPNIQVDTFKLSHCHRIVLVNYNKAHDVIEIRHYGILAKTAGLTPAAKKLSQGIVPKRVGEMEAIEDLFMKGGDYLSDTDGEGEEVELTQKFRKLSSGTKTKLKLVEIGPRMTLSLMKVETGFWEGETIFHKLFTKTPEEAAETAKRIKMKERLRQMRKKEQESNVAKKKAAEEAKKAEKEAERKRKAEANKRKGEEGGSDEEFEVVGEEEPDAKRRKVAFDEEMDYAEEPEGDENAQEAEGDDEGLDGPQEEDVAPKKKKSISRSRRSQIKKWKKIENTYDEQ